MSRGRPKKVKIESIKEEPKQTSKFQVKLECNDQIFNGQGDTLLEAMKTIRVPEFIVTLGTLTVTAGGHTETVIVNAQRLQRLFGERTDSVIQEIQLSTFVDFLGGAFK